MSNGRDRSRETVLTSLTSGGTANITVGGNTDIKGATIATTDADGKDTGDLTLKTGTLTYSDLSNTSYSSNMSAGFSTGAAIGDVVNEKTGETETQVSIGSNTTSAQLNDSSDYHKGKTLATVGQGSLIIGDEAGSDDTTALNRDVENSETDLFTVDRQQGNFDVSIDHRLFHEGGHLAIAEDVKRNEITFDSIADAMDDDNQSVGLTGNEEGKEGVLDHLEHKHDFFTATKNFITDENNEALVKTLNDPNATPEQKQAAYQSLSASIAKQFDLTPAEVMMALVGENGQQGQGAYGDGKIFFNDAMHFNLTDIVNTIGHETQHYLDDNLLQSNDSQTFEENREEYAGLMGEATADYVSFNFENSGFGHFGGFNLQNGTTGSELIRNNTQTYETVRLVLWFTVRLNLHREQKNIRR
ncbi:hypothetical protein [Vibrio quintilis]|uniref:Uncharacterized protein n=1 Tax=Vibrio quintilis TaxID=1117707 RepID=A0A1M7Z259_9VIBR|nr:hypothetical protein [Vibrio quintilis]SHO58961.1 hypothetical protein VQ7734_04736 [Vibrio quintilis]